MKSKMRTDKEETLYLLIQGWIADNVISSNPSEWDGVALELAREVAMIIMTDNPRLPPPFAFGVAFYLVRDAANRDFEAFRQHCRLTKCGGTNK